MPSGKPPRSTPEQLLAIYDSVGIERGVLLPESNPEFNLEPQGSSEVVEISEASPGRFIPFCNVDPRAMSNSASAPLGDFLAYYKSRGCKGLGELCANLAFLDPLVQNLFKAAEEHGLPATFHIATSLGGSYGLYDDPGLPQLEETLCRFPKLRLLGHSQAFWSEISAFDGSDRNSYPKGPVKKEGRVSQLMRKCPNLYGDLSAGSGFNAISRDEEFALRFIDEFQDRLLFGTDICQPDAKVPLAAFLLGLRDSGRLPEKVFMKLARENAIKLLGL